MRNSLPLQVVRLCAPSRDRLLPNLIRRRNNLHSDTPMQFTSPLQLIRIGASALLVLLLGACQSPKAVKEAAGSVDVVLSNLQSVPCCIALDQISASPAGTVGTEIDAWLGSTKQRLRTPLGTGYYVAVKVPDAAQQYHFEVQSFSSPATGGAVIPVPIVLVLNNDFTISRRSTVDMLKYWRAHPLGLWGERERLSVFVRVDRVANPAEQYVVVTTPEETHGTPVAFSNEVGGGISVVPLGSATAIYASPSQRFRARLMSSPEGEVRITNRSSLMSKPFDHLLRF